MQSAPPPTPGSLATAGEADRGLLRGRPRGLGVHRRSHWTVQDPRDTDGHRYGVGVKHVGRG